LNSLRKESRGVGRPKLVKGGRRRSPARNAVEVNPSKSTAEEMTKTQSELSQKTAEQKGKRQGE